MNDTTQTMFDTDAFLDSEVDNAFETQRTTIPAGDGYTGVIDRLIPPRVLDNGSIVMDIMWKVLGQDELAQSLNLEDIVVPQSAFLDMGPDGRLAWGVNQNITLGQVRAALGQNVAGQRWAPRQLVGAGPAKLKIENKPDKNNPNLRRNRVVFVTSA
jgi:hypothetical protein